MRGWGLLIGARLLEQADIPLLDHIEPLAEVVGADIDVALKAALV